MESQIWKDFVFRIHHNLIPIHPTSHPLSVLDYFWSKLCRIAVTRKALQVPYFRLTHQTDNVCLNWAAYLHGNIKWIAFFATFDRLSFYKYAHEEVIIWGKKWTLTCKQKVPGRRDCYCTKVIKKPNLAVVYDLYFSDKCRIMHSAPKLDELCPNPWIGQLQY